MVAKAGTKALAVFLTLISNIASSAEIPLDTYTSLDCRIIDAQAAPSLDGRIDKTDIVRWDSPYDFKVDRLDWKKKRAYSHVGEDELEYFKYENGRTAFYIRSKLSKTGETTRLFYRRLKPSFPDEVAFMTAELGDSGIMVGANPGIHLSWGTCVGRR